MYSLPFLDALFIVPKCNNVILNCTLVHCMIFLSAYVKYVKSCPSIVIMPHADTAAPDLIWAHIVGICPRMPICRVTRRIYLIELIPK